MEYYNDRKDELDENDKVCAFYTIFTRKEHYNGSIEEFKKDILNVAKLLKEYNGIFIFDKIYLEDSVWHLYIVVKTEFKNLEEFGGKVLKNERLEGYVDNELIKFNRHDCNAILSDYLEWRKKEKPEFKEIDISEINKELKEQFFKDAPFEEVKDKGNEKYNENGDTISVNKSFFNFGSHITIDDIDNYIDSH